ncbi:hypothetical protein N6Y36_04955 [Morganella morganii]|nr:hypothetical protein N6Y36_04955 [Morganella morganii]
MGVIIAQTYVASAVLYRSAQGAFASVDPAYVRTAMNLGLTLEKPCCWRKFRCVCRDC